MLEMWMDSVRQWLFPVRKKRQVKECAKLLRIQLEQKQESQATAINSPEHSLTDEEHAIIAQIHDRTNRHNRNNITRTAAYLEFYMRHPDIHWALLAHMVSRNGAWNMTDLKGSLLRNIVTDRECEDFFLFLERANWLIFGDAYPQLLVYEYSKQLGKPLFHLLSYFHISMFMQCMWRWYWERRDSELLSTALITNEQNYIEIHLMQKREVQQKVTHSPLFQLQTVLNASVVLFPLGVKKRVIGLHVDHFLSLERRIEVGKQLYAMMFRRKNYQRSIVTFAKSVTHTGSRADFWPQYFTDIEWDLSRTRKEVELGSLIVSPKLQEAWKDYTHTPVVPCDWFGDVQAITYLYPLWVPSQCNMTNRYQRLLTLLRTRVKAFP